MPYKCDGMSVGVLIFDADNRLLMITRAHAPSGIAPVAGHVRDEHPDYTHLDAAIAETREEVGLTVTREDLRRVYIQWHQSRCGADIPHPSGGHDWQVYVATRWSGTVVRAEEEATDARWYTPEQVQELAERTFAYARGEVTEEEWEASPGLEPVWAEILSVLERPYQPDAGFFDTVVQVADGRVMRKVRALYGDTRETVSGGRLVGDGDFSYVDPSGRRITLVGEELTVTERGCTGLVSASVSLPDPGTEAARKLAAAVLSALGLASAPLPG